MLHMLHRYRRLLLVCALFAIVTILILKSHSLRISAYEHRAGIGIQAAKWQGAPVEHDPPGVYDDWRPISGFEPANIEDAQSKSIDELCATFPAHLLTSIQPVLKTGHGVLEERVRPQLRSMSACLKKELLIVSDLGEEFDGYKIIDVIKDIPKHLTSASKQLRAWRELNKAAADKTLDKYNPASQAGWKIDKFKFLASVSRAWDMHPDKSWYVFYEADTYILWDTLFRLLENYDPDEPYYFGSATKGRLNTWFANGGEGYILSREAMRRLVRADHDEGGKYLGSKVSEEEWFWIEEDCCGDSTLGWTLARRGVFLSGLFPLFNPSSPHHIPFHDPQWCQPILSMHKPHTDDIEALFRWEWTQREIDRPILYRDLALSFHNLTDDIQFPISPREDWDAGLDDTFAPPALPNEHFSHDPNATPGACAAACEAFDDCLQWRWHIRMCRFTHVFRLGEARQASGPDDQEREILDEVAGKGGKSSWVGKVVGSWGGGLTSWKTSGNGNGNNNMKWEPEDKRFFSGWNVPRIQRWVDNHPCGRARWVRPSTKRIF